MLSCLLFNEYLPRNFPRKSREIGRFLREFVSSNPVKFHFFPRELSEALVMVDDENGSSVNLTATHVLKVESTVIQHDSLTSELRRFWDYESLGIQDQSLSLYDKFVAEVEFVEVR